METKNEEFQTLKTRIDQIKDPKYPIKLKEKIMKTKERTEQVRKENKQLESECRNAGKTLHKVENDAGIPHSLQTANERAREAAVLEEKNEHLSAITNAFQEQNAEQIKTIQQLNAKLSKMEEIASHYNISVDKNPLQDKYNALSKEVKEYEDGIKIMLSRNDRIMQTYFDNEIDELQYNLEKDKAYLHNIEDMIQKQVVTLRDLLSKEGIGDRSMKELFGKVRTALDDEKQMKGEEEVKQTKRDPRAKRPSMGKYMSERDELYKDLPLFSPSRENKKFAIRKFGKGQAGGVRKSTSPEEREKKKVIGEERAQPESEVKKSMESGINKDKLVLSDEPKISDRVQEQPAKTEASEDKKPFGKPFGVKKFANKYANDTTSADSNDKEEPNKGSSNGDKSDATGSKFSKQSDLNHVPGDGLKLNSQANQGLKLSDEPKKELTLQNGQTTQKNVALTLDGGQSSTQNKELTLKKQDSVPEDIPTEDLGAGSRMNRNRILKKDNKNEELNLNGGLKLNNDANTNGGLKLNDGVTLGKTENKDLKLDQKATTADESGIKDPFAKYDDLSNLDFSKKKNIGSQENGNENRFVDKKPEPFGEKKTGLFQYKNTEPVAEKKIESKPFTLENTQQNQPFSLSKQQQPQFRLGGGGGGDTLAQNDTNTEKKTFKAYEDDSNKKESLGLNFGDKSKADKDDGLSFLNDKTDDTNKKTTGLNFGNDNDEKKPRRTVVGKKTENDDQGKNKGGDNDFFNDLEM